MIRTVWLLSTAILVGASLPVQTSLGQTRIPVFLTTPQSLDELGSEFGHDMAIDPFTGDSFGYHITDDGPRIYSLSENGLDDGGIHSDRWEDDITNDAGSDDHVLWPPQHKPGG